MWEKIISLLVLGYLSMSRSFAYIGIPSLKIFVGEIVLGSFLIAKPQMLVGRLTYLLINRNNLGIYGWIYTIFLSIGIIEVLRGIYFNYNFVTILQNFVFNYYPLYIFVGLAIAIQDYNILPRIIRMLAWFNGIYGLSYILFLDEINIIMPGSTDVPIFGGPAGSALAIIGLLSFEKEITKKITFLLLINAFVLLGMQMRSEWLGFLLGLIIWGIITKRFGRVIGGGFIVLFILGFMLLMDINIPAPEERGGNISTRDIIGRALAGINPELAMQFTSRADVYAGTISWRKEWWQAIWQSVNNDTITFFIGHGYGFNLHELVPYLENLAIRSPHNIFFYVLGYSGIIGILTFYAFIFYLLRLLIRSYKITRNPFGIIYWVMGTEMTHFGNYLETPFCAIPFYLIIGMSLAPLYKWNPNRTSLN